MSDPFYRKELLRLAADAHAAGRLSEPHVTGHAHNPVCGDKVVVDLIVNDGHISEIAQEAKACLLTQASASILGRSLKGATRPETQRLLEAVRAMLESTAGVPASPFDAYGAFDGAVPYPNRHRCVLLPIEAVLAAFDALEAGEPEAVRRER